MPPPTKQDENHDGLALQKACSQTSHTLGDPTESKVHVTRKEQGNHTGYEHHYARYLISLPQHRLVNVHSALAVFESIRCAVFVSVLECIARG